MAGVFNELPFLLLGNLQVREHGAIHRQQFLGRFGPWRVHATWSRISEELARRCRQRPVA
jgi:hypothetical protein